VKSANPAQAVARVLHRGVAVGVDVQPRAVGEGDVAGSAARAAGDGQLLRDVLPGACGVTGGMMVSVIRNRGYEPLEKRCASFFHLTAATGRAIPHGPALKHTLAGYITHARLHLRPRERR
jgi:hypothetical protein